MSLFVLNTLTFTAPIHSYKAYTENKGKLPQDMRGRYKRQTVLANEDKKKIIAWLREKAFEHLWTCTKDLCLTHFIANFTFQVHDKKYNLIALKFRDWLNRYLQSPSLQSSGISTNINERTVQHYMLTLGFTYKRFQQGLQYTDGHERDDVRQYRGLNLEKLQYLEVSHKPPPTCNDKIPSWNAGDKTKAKRVVFIYHDQTTFATNYALSMGWHDPEGSRQL